MKPTIIGIAGPAGAGKSTFGDAIVRELTSRGYQATHESFAAPIKAATAAMGLTEDDRHSDPAYKAQMLPCGRTPRWLWQTLGTEWGRHTVGEDVWVNLLLERCNIPGYFFLVDDVRFPNEALAIQESGGLLLYLDRHEVVRHNHYSERHHRHLRSVANHVFHNNETPQRLISLAEWLVYEGLGL